jgi:hypothetical protein
MMTADCRCSVDAITKNKINRLKESIMGAPDWSETYTNPQIE